MKHGQVRNWRMELRANVTQMQTGNAVISIDTSSEHSASEKYCAHCKKWIDVVGVDGGIRWIIDHSHK